MALLSGNGQIEIANRWMRQLAGGHVHSDYSNYISIGICLVDDFNRDLPTQAQYQALDELIRYLRQRVGKIDGKYSIVLGHKEINPVPTDCPWNRFPLNWLHHMFPDSEIVQRTGFFLDPQPGFPSETTSWA